MNEIEYLLVCLMEECGEVAHAASKALRFGLDERKANEHKSNATRIAEEFIDLAAILEMLNERECDLLPKLDVDAGIEAKKEKVRKYMDYSRELGLLE